MDFSRLSALFATGFELLSPRIVRAQASAVVTRESVDRYLPELDNLADETLKRTGVPGLSVAVVFNDERFNCPRRLA